ncbi:MAG: peptide ABC transporter substrate-binding protein [Clostridia bacterium]|nr:peptide ABC transporter substrate-binding protein [Clostridia bacterium]
MKRILCLVLAILLLPVFSLAENVQDSLVIGLVSYRTYEIRPLIPQERDIMSLYALVYESLVTIDDNGIPQPLLAETWSETGGGNTWTFTLRENVTFSDGTPLTAADVAASGNYILNLANADVADKGFYQNIRYMVSSFEAPDERTVVVKAKRDYYGVLYSMTFPVVHQSQVETASPLGTGPYVISAFSPGSYLWLAANENWWQMQPQVREIMASLFPSNKELITAYEYGQVDTAITRSVAAAQYKSGISSLSIAYSTRQLEVLLLNNSSPEFEDVRVRQAIRYAINKNLISQNVYMGMTINANTPVPPDNWLYYDQENTFTYNPEKAIKLLEEAGWTDTDGDNVMDRIMDGKKRNLRLRLYVYEDPENDVRFETANMIVDMLAEIKIKAVVTTMTYGEEQEALEAGSFDMALCAFQMDVVPDYGFFLRKGNNQNYCRYVSSEMTSLIDSLRTQEDQTDFAYTSQTIQQLFANDTPFICLFYRSGAILTRKMFTTVRSIREFELLRGIEAFGR